MIAAFNAEAYVRDAMLSVLQQTWRNLECIVVDDGSTDQTAAIAHELGAIDKRVRLISQNNRGVASARNVGIEAARGKYVAFLDADDVWMPSKLSRQVALLERQQDLGLVYCAYAITNARLNEVAIIRPDPGDPDLSRWLMLEGAGIGFSFTGVVRTDVLRRIGGFDPALSTSADLELALRLATITGIGGISEPLAMYRSHPGQMHLDPDAFERDMTAVLKRHLPSAEQQIQRHRGFANLYTRLFFWRCQSGEWRVAARCLTLAIRHNPSRVVCLPLTILIRRIRRRALAYGRRLVGRTLTYPNLAIEVVAAPPDASGRDH